MRRDESRGTLRRASRSWRSEGGRLMGLGGTEDDDARRGFMLVIDFLVTVRVKLE